MAVKRVLLFGVAIAVGALFYYQYVQNTERKTLEKAEWDRAKRETVEGISRLVAETNAVDDWERQLSKGKKYRLEPILTIELERLWMSGRPILFLGAIDDIKISRIKGALERAAKRASVKASPYVLRHTAAVWMAEDGVPLEEISQYLGHTNLEVTRKHYARFSSTYLRRAAASLQLRDKGSFGVM
jgi:integrase